MERRRVVIMGAAGRDFHNFNVYFRNNPKYEVVAFTAAQIPGIENRRYPPELAGHLYPNGIPIYPEEKLPELIEKYDVDEVVLSYSDLLYEDVMHKASLVLSCGASFVLLGPKDTMLESRKPVIAICAARTGCGKSPTSRRVVSILHKRDFKVAVVRHPMPYGDLRKQVAQRFASLEDLKKYECTIEEMEEYEPHIKRGAVVFAGVDYEKILRMAEEEGDVVVWEGGNNDFPFYKPDILIAVVDPHRPGHEVGSYPGEVNVRMADVIVISKVNTAKPENVKKVEENVMRINKKAIIIKAALEISVEDPKLIEGKKVLCIEDGPTVTHGHMPYGAAYIAAEKYGASEIVDPRPYAVGSIKKAFEEYKHLQKVLPALGYGERQMKELEEVIRKADCDLVLIGTPVDLTRVLKVDKPVVRVSYELVEVTRPDLEETLFDILGSRWLGK